MPTHIQIPEIHPANVEKRNNAVVRYSANTRFHEEIRAENSRGSGVGSLAGSGYWAASGVPWDSVGEAELVPIRGSQEEEEPQRCLVLLDGSCRSAARTAPRISGSSDRCPGAVLELLQHFAQVGYSGLPAAANTSSPPLNPVGGRYCSDRGPAASFSPSSSSSNKHSAHSVRNSFGLRPPELRTI